MLQGLEVMSQKEEKDICLIKLKKLGNHETSLQGLGKEVQALYLTCEARLKINGQKLQGEI